MVIGWYVKYLTHLFSKVFLVQQVQEFYTVILKHLFHIFYTVLKPEA